MVSSVSPPSAERWREALTHCDALLPATKVPNLGSRAPTISHRIRSRRQQRVEHRREANAFIAAVNALSEGNCRHRTDFQRKAAKPIVHPGGKLELTQLHRFALRESQRLCRERRHADF